MKTVFNLLAGLVWILLASMMLVRSDGMAHAALLEADSTVEEYAQVVDRSVEQAREWMGQQIKPQLQALAWIPQSYPGGDTDAQAERYFLDALNGILLASPDAATLHFLALACESRDVMPRCIESGMADAVKRIDPHNFATWSIVYRDQPGALLDALEQSRSFDTFFAEAVNGWLQALDASTQPINESTRTVMPHAIVLATATPAISPLLEACKSAVEAGPDSALSSNCFELSADMAETGRSLLVQQSGRGLHYRLAEIIQAENLAELDRQRTAFRDRTLCLVQALDALEDQPDRARAYIHSLLEHSELEAIERMAHELGVRCGARLEVKGLDIANENDIK